MIAALLYVRGLGEAYPPTCLTCMVAYRDLFTTLHVTWVPCVQWCGHTAGEVVDDPLCDVQMIRRLDLIRPSFHRPR